MEDTTKLEAINIADLFTNAEKRIAMEEQKNEQIQLEKNIRRQQIEENTKNIATAIVYLVFGTLKKTKKYSGKITKIDENLGILSSHREHKSGYFFDEDGMTFFLNYSHNSSDCFGSVENFLGVYNSCIEEQTHEFGCSNQKIDYLLLREILSRYNIGITRNVKTEFNCNSTTWIDIVNLYLSKNSKIIQLPKRLKK